MLDFECTTFSAACTFEVTSPEIVAARDHSVTLADSAQSIGCTSGTHLVGGPSLQIRGDSSRTPQGPTILLLLDSPPPAILVNQGQLGTFRPSRHAEASDRGGGPIRFATKRSRGQGCFGRHTRQFYWKSSCLVLSLLSLPVLFPLMRRFCAPGEPHVPSRSASVCHF